MNAKARQNPNGESQADAFDRELLCVPLGMAARGKRNDPLRRDDG